MCSLTSINQALNQIIKSNKLRLLACYQLPTDTEYKYIRACLLARSSPHVHRWCRDRVGCVWDRSGIRSGGQAAPCLAEVVSYWRQSLAMSFDICCVKFCFVICGHSFSRPRLRWVRVFSI